MPQIIHWLALLAPLYPLTGLAAAGALLRSGLGRGPARGAPRIIGAAALVGAVIVLGPFLTDADGILGPTFQLVSLCAVVLGALVAAGLVASHDEGRLAALLAVGVPLLFWGVTVLRDTREDDRATRCAVKSMARALDAVASAHGAPPSSVDDPAVLQRYREAQVSAEHAACARDPLASLSPFSRYYPSHLNGGGWRYEPAGAGYSLAFAYEPRRLGWLTRRVCIYQPPRRASCGPAW